MKHSNRTKHIVVDETIEGLSKDRNGCKAFVESLYEDNKTPSERFGITHEQLSTLEDVLFPEDSKDK